MSAFVPWVRVTLRSVAVRTVWQGTPSADASSCTSPVSVTTSLNCGSTFAL